MLWSKLSFSVCIWTKVDLSDWYWIGNSLSIFEIHSIKWNGQKSVESTSQTGVFYENCTALRMALPLKLHCIEEAQYETESKAMFP